MRHLHALMLCVWFSSTSPLFSLCCLSSLLSSFSFSWPSTSSSTMWWTNSLCIVRLSHRLWAQRPAHLRDHWTIHPGILRREQIMNSHDLEYDDCTIGIALSSPLFTQEREDDASRRRAYHFHDEGLSSSQSLSVGHTTGRTVVEQFGSQISNVRDSAPQPRKWANQDPFWNDREEQILTNFMIRDSESRGPGRLWQKKYSKVEWSYPVTTRGNLSCSSRRRTTSTRSSTSSWAIIEAKLGSSWSSWEKSQWDGRFEAISRLNIRHNCEEKIGLRSRYYSGTYWQDTGIAKWNQLHEWFERLSRCWISSQWKFLRCQSTSVMYTSSRSWWDAKPFSGNAELQKNDPPSIWDEHGTLGNVFADPVASSWAPYPQELNPWSSDVSEHTSQLVMSENQTPVQDQRCQSGPSAKNSVILQWREILQRIMGQTNNNCGISDLHFDKFPTPATFACWKIRFKTEVCICSQFPTEAMHWIKEVEMVDSVYDLKSSSSIRGIPMPNFEVLDARIASALNKIIHNFQFQRRISLEEQKGPEAGPFPSRKTDCLLDLWVLPGHRSQWFQRELCRPIYNCSSKWWYSGIRLEVGWKFIINDENPTWWHLGRIVQTKNTRVWETQDRVGIV